MMSKLPTILITGGTGFVGSHLVEALLASGVKPNQIHLTSYGSTNSAAAANLPADAVHQLNMADAPATLQLLNQLQPDQIYHLASLSAVGHSLTQIEKTLQVNSAIQLSLLLGINEACPQARTLIVGSALEYLPQNRPLTESDPLGPISPYAVSKVVQDMLAYSFYRQFQLPIIIARPFNHFGERQTTGFVVTDFASQIAEIMAGRQSPTIKVGNLDAERDFSDVKDIVAAYILLMAKGKIGETYNLGSGRSYVIKDILDQLLKLAKIPIKIEVDPQKYRPVDVPRLVANIDKIKALGWEPQIPISETLARVLQYYQSLTI